MSNVSTGTRSDTKRLVGEEAPGVHYRYARIRNNIRPQSSRSYQVPLCTATKKETPAPTFASTRPEVKKLAEEIIAAQTGEITQMEHARCYH